MERIKSRKGELRGTKPQRGREGTGRFTREAQPRRRGRPLGSQNYWTREIKEAVQRAIERYGEDGEGKDGLEGFIFRCCRDEPRSVLNLVRAMMPKEVTLEHKNAPARNAEEILKRMERLGVRTTLLQDLRTIEYHTPQQVLELTEEDVIGEGNEDSGGG